MVLKLAQRPHPDSLEMSEPLCVPGEESCGEQGPTFFLGMSTSRLSPPPDLEILRENVKAYFQYLLTRSHRESRDWVPEMGSLHGETLKSGCR